MANVQFLHTYISHIRLSKTIERNLLMAESMKANLSSRLQETGDAEATQGKATKPEDLVRIYDIILQVGALENKGRVGKMGEGRVSRGGRGGWGGGSTHHTAVHVHRTRQSCV